MKIQETQSKYEKSVQLIKLLKDEIEDLKRNCNEMKSKQSDVKAINDAHLLEEKARLIMDKQNLEEKTAGYKNALKEFEAVVRGGPEAHALCDLLLYLVEAIDGITEVSITVEARSLQFLDLVGGLAHDVGHALAGLQVRGPVGHHHVLSGDVHRHLPTYRGVVVDLLEGIT